MSFEAECAAVAEWIQGVIGGWWRGRVAPGADPHVSAVFFSFAKTRAFLRAARVQRRSVPLAQEWGHLVPADERSERRFL